MRIHNCIAWQNCERRNFPLSLFHPPLSLFSPPPFYFATHYSTLARICAPFYRYFKSSWNSINLSTLLIREEACARMHHRLVKVARSFLSIPSIPSCFERSILSILLSSPFFFFFFFFRIVWFFFFLDFERSFVGLVDGNFVEERSKWMEVILIEVRFGRPRA